MTKSKGLLVVAAVMAVLIQFTAAQQTQYRVSLQLSGTLRGNTGTGTIRTTFTTSVQSSCMCSINGSTFQSCETGTVFRVSCGYHDIQAKCSPHGRNIQADLSSAITLPCPKPPTPPTRCSVNCNLQISGNKTTLRCSTSCNPATFYCMVDDGVKAQCPSPTMYSLSEGLHNIKVYVRFGINGPMTLIKMFVVNITQATSPPPCKVHLQQGNDAENITFTVSQLGTPLESIIHKCRLDSNSFELCNGSVTYTKLSEGSHNFYIKCCWKDRPDVCTDAIKRPFIVNLTDPGDCSYSVSLQLTGTSSGDMQSIRTTFTTSLPGSCMCSINGSTFQSCETGTIFQVPCGKHAMQARCSPHGRTIQANFSSAITLPCPEPPTPPTRCTVNCSLQISGNKTTLRCSTSCNPATFYCMVDDGVKAQCPSPTMYSLSEGLHNIKVYVRFGINGPMTLVETFEVNITQAMSPPPCKAQIQGRGDDENITFTVSQLGTPSESIIHKCRLDSNSFELCNGSVTYTKLSEGSHNIYIKCCWKDRTDVCTEEVRHPFHITGSVRSVALLGSVKVIGKDIAVTLISALRGVMYSCTLLRKLDNSALMVLRGPEECPGSITYYGLPPGQYLINVTYIPPNSQEEAYTTLLGEDQLILIPFPECSVENLKGELVDNMLSVTFRGTHPNVTFLCQFDARPVQLCTSPYIVSTTGLNTGNHSIVIMPISDTSIECSSANLIITISSGPVSTAEPTCNRSIQLDLNDDTATVVANIEGLQCSVDEGELISCPKGTQFSGLGTGSHVFNVKIIGNDTNCTANETFEVTLGPCANKTVGNVNANTVGEGNIITFQFDVDDGLDVTCSFRGTAIEPCTSPVIVNSTSLCNGQYTFNLNATCQEDSQLLVGNVSVVISFTRATEPKNCIDPSDFLTASNFSLVSVPELTNTETVFYTLNYPNPNHRIKYMCQKVGKDKKKYCDHRNRRGFTFNVPVGDDVWLIVTIYIDGMALESFKLHFIYPF